MTSGRGCALVLAFVFAIIAAEPAGAQTGAGGSPSGRGQTPKVAAPPGTATQRITPQGFSVVLVLADLQDSKSQDDVPPAARRALMDMKDFLPYKSYRLLDAAWLLGQASSGALTRLRGPDDQEYELRLTAAPTSGGSGRVSVRFWLSDAGPAEARAAAEARGRQSQVAALRSDLSRLESELKSKRATGGDDQSDLKQLEQRVAELKERIAATSQATTVRRTASPAWTASGGGAFPRPDDRAIIDTNFSMEVGETVVVGTSRLKGNSMALIALLTAVPPRSQAK